MSKATSIKRSTVIFLLIYLLSILSWCSAISSENPDSQIGEAVILHTNDIHGHIKPVLKRNFINLGTMLVSGYANIATVVENVEDREPDTIYVDAGDWITGGFICDYYKGMPMIELMNQLVDVATIGNHEFDWGVDNLNSMLSEARFDVVVANVVPADENGKKLVNVKPFVIKDVGHIRLGIIGVVTDYTPKITNPDNVRGIKFLSPISMVKSYARYLKPKVDQIVVLSHLGVRYDKELARRVDIPLLIIGGHSHTLLKEPITYNKDNSKTYIVQAGKYGYFVGKVVLRKMSNGKVELKSYHVIPVIDEAIPDNPGISELISQLERDIAPIANKVVAYMKNYHSRESIAKFVAYAAMREANAQIGAMNIGGIRTDIQPGEFKYEDLYALYPFHDHLVIIELKGRDLIEAAHRARSEKNLLFYNLTILENGDVLYNDKLVDPNATYRIATTDFMASGGDGYIEFTRGKHIHTGKLFRDVIGKYLEQLDEFYGALR